MLFSCLSSTVIFFTLGAFHIADAASIKRAPKSVCEELIPVVEMIQKDLFDDGECGEEAHSALRLSFHDAIGFSINGGKGGGADGSILVFNDTELAYAANSGIDDITARQFPVFQETNLTAGDFVHLAAAIGTANCPGAPSLKFYYGRPPPVNPAPDGTVPEPTDNVTAIIDRFADAGFAVPEIIAMLASHTIAAADVVDATIPGTPFDSTVDTFDTQFYLEVLLKGTSFPGNGSQPGEVLSPLAGEMRLQSDFLLARDPRTACLWQGMIDNQDYAVTVFKTAMAKLQLLGQNIDELTDCSEIIPTSAPLTTNNIKYPASFSQEDVEISCTSFPFPSLATVDGPAPTIPPVPVPSS